MHLDEFARRDHASHHLALGAERRDERGDDDQAGIGHQLRHLADAADILDAIGIGEAEILVEPVADIVAIQQEGVAVHSRQLLLDDVGDGRFARARKAGEPQHGRLLVLEPGMMLAADVCGLPVDVLRTAQREVKHPRRDGGVADLVDQDEAAERAILLIGFEH